MQPDDNFAAILCTRQEVADFVVIVVHEMQLAGACVSYLAAIVQVRFATEETVTVARAPLDLRSLALCVQSLRLAWQRLQSSLGPTRLAGVGPIARSGPLGSDRNLLDSG
jgi:hypothetical protein